MDDSLNALDGRSSIENRGSSLQALSPAEAHLGPSRGPGVQGWLKPALALTMANPGLKPGVAMMAAEALAKAARIGGVLASCGSRAFLSRTRALQPAFESRMLRRSLWRPPRILDPG